MQRIAIYAIAKNEEQFVDRWYESAKYADGVFVLDTGSTDKTLRKLTDKGVTTFTAFFDPFRFDIARNFILNQISEDEYDYALFLDMDEILEKDWYTKLQSYLLDNPEITGINTRMVYTKELDGSPSITYNRMMVTKTGHYSWMYPVHELLTPKPDKENYEGMSDILVFHEPDLSKSRADYLNLLYLGVQERPNDPRCAQYLARELMTIGRYEESIAEYFRHIEIEPHPWLRSESHRAVASCLETMGNSARARYHHLRSCAEAPDIRESWAEACTFYFRAEWMHSALGCIEAMLEVTELPDNTIIRNDIYYNAWPYHMAAICYNALGDSKNAQKHIQHAASLSPEDPTIISDLIKLCNIPIEKLPKDPL